MSETAQSVEVGPIRFGAGAPFVFIAGPCVIENAEHPFRMAEAITEICAQREIPYIFKASFDKANRTSLDGFRGPGLNDGLKILAEIRDRFDIPVTTDIHEPYQAAAVADIVDLIQIPAFLCRQTDLLRAAAETAKAVNIKKGQFLAPWDMAHAVDKVRHAGNSNVIVSERGSSFGYNNLVVDMRSFPLLREIGCPVIFDVTHSLQLPGGAGKASSGQSRFIPQLAAAGLAAGVDGVFMEVHDNPADALSDGPNSCPLGSLAKILDRLVAIQAALRSA